MGLFQSPQNVETNKMRSWEVQLQDGKKVTVNNRLDCIGDICPRPQLKLKKSIKGMESGEIVEVLINNPPSLETLPALCPEIGATHLDTLKEPNLWKLYIQKDLSFRHSGSGLSGLNRNLQVLKKIQLHDSRRFSKI